VDHVAGAVGGDPLRFAVGLAVGVDELPAVQSQTRQQAGYGAAADGDSLASEFEGDTGGGTG
jgi:hypothetical protein